jgi:hypothetical protein
MPAARKSGPSNPGFDAKHPRAAGGRFGSKGGTEKPGRKLIGEERLKTSGVTVDDAIEVLSSRVRAYQGAKTVRDFVEDHPKGRAYALRKLAADHKAGRIGFKGAAQAPKQAAGSGAAIDPKLSDGSFRANTERVTEGLKGDDFLISLNGSKRYLMGITVDQAAANHPKGRAAGLKQIAADLKAGRLQAERTKGAKAKAPARNADIEPGEGMRPSMLPGEESFSWGSGTTRTFRDQVRKGYDAVPAKIRTMLREKGVTISGPKSASQFDSSFAGSDARGHTAGSTLEHAPGFYRPTFKQVVVSEQHLDVYAPGKGYRKADDPAGIIRHEIGHAVDWSQGRLSNKPEFAKAFNEDLRAFERGGGKRTDPRYAYYLQRDDAGPSEMFAEQFNQHLGGSGDPGSDLRATFPRTAGYIADLVKRLS